ncbi:LysR family transcriptional regulator [Dactylosporangium sp. AC04546]|uniref:LysR family transcriptional regulator n=1 Tax=Dactylosporangium sp. AC04546 TaxID=2862460 RepID=UPI001EDF9DBD|nr:LysR family transcriptional regulator [Dactylosporangium sp. AC04546]WVK79027.1 LysR family transcriptional regulator [Dactylosporangium sp. AC04546]
MTGPPHPDDDDLEPGELTPRDPRDAMSLQTAWLRSFLAVADKGGFGAATVALHLSQSRVSAHIAALEHALGVTLFDRKARPIRTTAAGELFRGHAMAALLELQRGIDAVRSTLDNVVAHVTVGSYPSVSSTYLPGVLQELQVRHPGVTVELHEGNAATLEEMVAGGTVDLAFRPLLPKMRETTLCHRTIWHEDIVAVMRENDPLAERASVSVDDVLARPLIGNPAGSEEEGGGFDVRNTLGEAAGRANIAYLTDQPTTLVALVRAAFGIGVINRLALQTTSTEGLTIRTIDSPTAHRNVALFWLRRRADSAVVKAFLDAQQRAPLPPGVLPI